MTVAVLDEVGHDRLDTERASRLFAAALSTLGLDLERIGEVSVALVDPETIRDLNFEFRSRDIPTDVLSFEVDGPYGEMVGEVVICPACVSPEMGVEELVVHGALHLSGMDHGENFEASEMALAQEAVARSFDHAYRGLIYAVRTQRNMRFHVVAAAVVLVGSMFLGVSKLELAALVLVIMFVFVTEMFNTALEFAVDLATKEYRPLAKLSKDVSAGAVLVSSVGAVLVGYLVLANDLGPLSVETIDTIRH